MTDVKEAVDRVVKQLKTLIAPDEPQAKEALSAAVSGSLSNFVAEGKLEPDFKVDVRRDPADPTNMIVDMEIKPVMPMGVAKEPDWFCWSCDWEGDREQADGWYLCPLCGAKAHDRRATNLDRMGQAVKS